VLSHRKNEIASRKQDTHHREIQRQQHEMAILQVY
jgi:hypothetical protein